MKNSITSIIAIVMLFVSFSAYAQTTAQSDEAATIKRLEADIVQIKNELALLRSLYEKLLGPISDQEKIRSIPINDGLRGNPEASLVLVNFCDFQSEYCARLHSVILKLLSEYDELGYAFKNYPLTVIHPQAIQAALAALAAAKQDARWEMHDLLFDNTRNLNSNLYLSLAEQLDLDLVEFNHDMRSADTLKQLSNDEKLAQELGVEGVPALFLNGRRLYHWNYDYLKEQIEQLR